MNINYAEDWYTVLQAFFITDKIVANERAYYYYTTYNEGSITHRVNVRAEYNNCPIILGSATPTLESYATKQNVTDAIAEADISDKLNDYYTKEETYSKTEVDTKIANVEVDLTGYATEKFVTDKTDILSSDVSTNKGDIKTLSGKVGELDTAIKSIDTSPRLTYDVAYNDVENPDVGENVFVFYEITNEGQENEEKTPKQKFTIVGGGGGGATSSTLKIGYVTTSPLVVTMFPFLGFIFEFSKFKSLFYIDDIVLGGGIID